MKSLRAPLRISWLLFLLSATTSSAVVEANTGDLVLTVDATRAPARILRALESISVQPGPLTLLYPKWIPGEHGPTGPVADLASLRISGNGQPLSWRRDAVDMYAVRLTVPENVGQVDLTFEFLLAPQTEGFTSGASSTSELAVINWNQIVLYPAGPACDSLLVLPRLVLPKGWQYGTALETDAQSGDTVSFTAISLTTLVDSPVLTGIHFRRIDVSADGAVRHTINIAADGEAALDMPPWQIDAYKRLVLEANALFGARHYRHYDFLVTLSSQLGSFGLEHHESSDNRMPERTLIDSGLQSVFSTLLAHEFSHSWNGKYRRPEGLTPRDFHEPLRSELLWVYEGLTTYLGVLLGVRSGISTPDRFHDDFALMAARLDNLPGRTWRSLQDVSDAAQVLYEARGDWQSVRRGVDFYEESCLLWLEADVLIRSLTKGEKSLDDFCRGFLGGDNTAPTVRPFEYADVVRALNDVAPYDWNAFWSNRLESLDTHAPIGCIEQSGWKLAYHESPGHYQEAVQSHDKTIDSRFSVGVLFNESGSMNDVIPGFPAAQAGLAPGMTLIAIDGRKFSKDAYRDALKRGTQGSNPMEFLASNGDFFKTYLIHYNGGERYPYLERDTSKADVLSEIIKPIAAAPAQGKR